MMRQAKRVAQTLGLETTRRHIFICVKSENQACCDANSAVQSWLYLKDKLQELGLGKHGGIQRSKADCLRLCADGPVCVVYPDGVWYGRCTPQNLDKIIQRHLIGGQIVEELLITRMKSLLENA